MDRDCDKCIYHSSGGCSQWECNFTTVADLMDKTVEDIVINASANILKAGDNS